MILLQSLETVRPALLLSGVPTQSFILRGASPKVREHGHTTPVAYELASDTYHGLGVVTMEVWKVREMDRKARNGEVKAGWVKEVENWGVEKDSAKTDHRKPRWNKPKMPSMEKALPKPKLCDFAEESEEEEENDEVDDGENSNSA